MKPSQFAEIYDKIPILVNELQLQLNPQLSSI